LDTLPLYTIAGQPVYLPRLLLGIALTLFLGFLNYRGIRLSANFQKIMTSTVLLIFVILAAISTARGAPANFHPLFQTTPFISILLTLQIVPYFMTGFESVPKYAEESNPDFRQKSYMSAIAMALGVGAFFYAVSIAAVAYITPWQSLLGQRFSTAIAFERGVGAKWTVNLILFMALFGLFQCFNGNFAASTRLLFAYGRRRTIHPSFATVHQIFQTPSVAVLAITAGTLAGLLLGDAILVPVSEVGSMASALGWFAACTSFWVVEKLVLMRLVTGLGIAVSLLLILMKVLPVFPGHFSLAEWIASGIWIGLGMALRVRN
jgi:amino acid transporter